ncbi:NACHT domain-containing protein [Algibacter lectus]|uniref:NACHT domain-containing protein n=1 Tax=Algibacter lectus TaxID=221126 RepID=A0A090V8S4_9FLAO|nr:NACHT domain-containing protein [Algibacter lectus]GAL61255.1 hypothetical protein JCM19300_4201 [Algibacter lectus]
MKEITSKLIDSLPDIIKNIADWSKENFDKHAQEILGNSTGTAGIIIKLFGQTLIDKYFENIEENKLKEFGESVYLQSAYKQASKSIIEIENELTNSISASDFSLLYSSLITNELKTFTPENILLIFQPEYHPSVVFVKNNYVNILKKLNANTSAINKFLIDFNSNIANEVENNFGKSYPEHLSQISKYSLNKNEAKLLWDTSKLGVIGFTSTENLEYEETYALWKDVNTFKNFENDSLSNHFENEDDDSNENEKKLIPIVNLIETYFNTDSNNHLDKILFIVADFGKGKSIFLKHYASELAKKYIKTKEGEFPIYFNLRNFHNYSHSTKLGVIEDYLLTEYAIDIKSPDFEKKKYIFLIDSLDESGELNKVSIEKVINSIQQIQNLDKEKFRTNKIIITTRPFDDGLDQHLKCHNPKIRLNSEKRDIPQYLSIYGFKKDQFNNWLINSINNAQKTKISPSNEITNKILTAISKGENYDVYKDLIENRTLSKSELRRPIFAYMIYQLILNNVNFLEVGKIGVYLSFLNLLSKDAKHINDPNYNINLTEEFEYRNLLHSISALWMFERHQGKQGSLIKADICRVLDGFNRNETDSQVLERYKNKNVNEIEFLSHSYFGENDNKLHFQHQSFAEILLAEYYLKVFIKYALDKDFNIEEARTKLLLGFPTEQTIRFLIDLLKLLKDSTVNPVTSNTIEKRKLLFPLLATLATEKNNNLFCNNLYYEWFNKHPINSNETIYPKELITNWCFDDSKIDRILLLCKEILNSNNTYLLSKNESKSSLYDNELTLIQNTSLNDLPLDFDKWLSLLVGNKLCNNIDDNTKPVLFNTKYKIEPKKLFDLIIQSAHRRASDNNIPIWGKKLFLGIDMRLSNDRIYLFAILNNLDFSYSHLKNIDFSGSVLGGTLFNYTTLENINFSHCYMWSTSFKNIVNIVDSECWNVIISDLLIPFSLMPSKSKKERIIMRRTVMFNNIRIPDTTNKDKEKFEYSYINSVLSITSELFAFHYAKKEITIRKINELIKFQSAIMKKEYLDKIKTIANNVYKK